MSTDLAETREQNIAELPQQPQANEASGLMVLVERLAIDKEIDPDRVERAFEMYKQVRMMDAEAQFNQAMASAQAEIQPVAANKRNSHTNSDYAAIDAIHSEAKPIWTKYGFSVVTKTGRSDLESHIKVICEVRHAGGHKEVHEDDWPLDIAGSQGKVNKTPIQAKGSSSTYARRYTELMIFDVAIAAMDNDGNSSAKKISEKQAADLTALMDEAINNKEKFLKWLKVEKIEDLPLKDYQKAINELEKQRANK